MDDNQWHEHDIIGTIILELHNSWKWIVLIELQLSCNELHCIYNELQFYNSCNLSISITMYKYSESQVSSVTQKLSCKASYKTPFFSHSEMWHF